MQEANGCKRRKSPDERRGWNSWARPRWLACTTAATSAAKVDGWTGWRRGAKGKTNCSQVIGRARNPRPNPGRSFLLQTSVGAAASLLQQMESLQQRLRLSMMSTSQSQFRASSFIHSFTSPSVSYQPSVTPYSVLGPYPMPRTHVRTRAFIRMLSLAAAS